jgi:hypothetical protein
MKAPALKPPVLWVITLVVAAVIYALETFAKSGSGGSLILNLTFFLAIAEGTIAVIAAAEVSRATWHRPLVERMLPACCMIPVIAILFLVFIPQMDIYPWWGDPHFWAQKWLFIARHVGFMAAAWLLARRFAAEALRGTDASRRWGVLYLIVFVLGQTLVGLEWVMSLEKPWFSTLFGAYFMVESWLSGIIVGAFILLSMRAPDNENWRFAQKSIGGLVFGFSIFWAYFYFSQLIVIWYGNLPEEVQYLARRIGYHTPYWALARSIFALCWVLPFFILLGKRPKMNPRIVSGVGVLILLGYYFEKWLMIGVAVPVSIPIQVVETAILAVVFWLVMGSGPNTLPAVERSEAVKRALEPAEQH